MLTTEFRNLQYGLWHLFAFTAAIAIWCGWPSVGFVPLGALLLFHKSIKVKVWGLILALGWIFALYALAAFIQGLA